MAKIERTTGIGTPLEARQWLYNRFGETLTEALARARSAVRHALAAYESSQKPAVGDYYTDPEEPSSDYLDICFDAHYLPFIIHLADYGKRPIYTIGGHIEYDDD